MTLNNDDYNDDKSPKIWNSWIDRGSFSFNHGCICCVEKPKTHCGSADTELFIELSFKQETTGKIWLWTREGCW